VFIFVRFPIDNELFPVNLLYPKFEELQTPVRLRWLGVGALPPDPHIVILILYIINTYSVTSLKTTRVK